MKSPKEDYEIRKLVVSDLGTGEDLLNFFSFYTLIFIMYLYLEAITVLLKWPTQFADFIILFRGFHILYNIEIKRKRTGLKEYNTRFSNSEAS